MIPYPYKILLAGIIFHSLFELSDHPIVCGSEPTVNRFVRINMKFVALEHS